MGSKSSKSKQNNKKRGKKGKIPGTVEVWGKNRQNQSSVFFCFFCFWAGVCSAGVLRGVTCFFCCFGRCVFRGSVTGCYVFFFFLAWVCSAGVLRGVCVNHGL